MLVSVLTKLMTTRQISLIPFTPMHKGNTFKNGLCKPKCTKTSDSVKVLSLTQKQPSKDSKYWKIFPDKYGNTAADH